MDDQESSKFIDIVKRTIPFLFINEEKKTTLDKETKCIKSIILAIENVINSLPEEQLEGGLSVDIIMQIGRELLNQVPARGIGIGHTASLNTEDDDNAFEDIYKKTKLADGLDEEDTLLQLESAPRLQCNSEPFESKILNMFDSVEDTGEDREAK